MKSFAMLWLVVVFTVFNFMCPFCLHSKLRNWLYYLPIGMND